MDEEFLNWNWTQLSEDRKDMWNWAVHYLDLEWNVMPIEAAGKKPRLYRWEHLNKERVTPDMVDQWWNDWPHANIGLICGKISGVIVLDIDEPDKFDRINEIPETSMSQTARGYHYFFRYPAEGSFPSFKGSGFDVQSDGKYVILPPSEHSSGKFYEWKIDPWRALDPFADIPKWLYTLGSNEIPRGATGPCAITPIFSMESYFEPVKPGDRNNAAARLAGYLFNRDREFEEVLCTLQGWNLRNPQPLSGREIRTVVESVFKKHQRRK